MRPCASKPLLPTGPPRSLTHEFFEVVFAVGSSGLWRRRCFVDRHASLSLRDIYCINQQLRLARSTGGGPAIGPWWDHRRRCPRARCPRALCPWRPVPARRGTGARPPASYSRHDHDERARSVVVNTQLDSNASGPSTYCLVGAT